MTDTIRGSITRRTVLGTTGLIILGGGFLNQATADGDVAVSLNDACSSASIEMHPSEGRTVTGVIETLDGSEVDRTPVGGQTVTGGGSGNIELSLCSPGAHIHRAFVVEGRDLEGSIIAEETCERSDGESGQGTHGDCGSGAHSQAQSQSQSVNVGDASQVDSDSVNVESIREMLRELFGID